MTLLMESKSLLLIIFILSRTQGIELKGHQFLNNFCLSSTGYKSVSEIGLYGCARQCGMESGCKSFTYSTAHHRCLLNEDNANTASAQFGVCPGYIYGDRAMMVSDATVMGTCVNHTCPHYSTCVPLTSASRVCLISACGSTPSALIPVNNDDVSSTRSAVGVTRSIQCDTGYIGYKTTVCLASGLWSEPDNQCTDCGTPPSVSHASVLSGTTTIGSQRVYQCSATSTASGSASPITCQHNGTWSTPSLVCIPDCVIPYMITAHTAATAAPAGTTISFTCKTGYDWVDGTGDRTCNDEGAWGTLDIACDPVNCGIPPMPSGCSSMSYYDFNYPNSVTFYCDHGLTATHSDRTITCGSDGYWSTPLFQCL